MKSVGGWSAQDDETSPAWGSTLVHGGMIETIMDEVAPAACRYSYSSCSSPAKKSSPLFS